MRLLTQALTARTAGPAAAARLLAFFLLITFTVEMLVMLLLPWLVPGDASPVVVGCVDALLLAVILGPIAWRVFLTPLARMHDARGLLMGHILSAQEDERSRISRDLHDGLGQSLTSILLRLRVLEDSCTGDAERANVAAIRQVTADALADLRRLVHETRPPILEELGLGAALEKQLVDARTASGIDTTLICHGCDDRRLPVAIETALYRVIQEAVTNTLKHAAADRLTVTVTIGPEDVTASVVDDGTGFNVAAVRNDGHRSFGLLGMTERLRPFAGTVTLSSSAGTGTTVTFRIPLPPPEAPP